ncbi:hypothetical protein G210_0329, partial [Candida maltosa Xu316]
MLIHAVFCLAVLFGHAIADDIPGVFTSFDSLTFSNPRLQYTPPNYPTWNAVLGWELDAAVARPGDKFTLFMPCVFKFVTDEQTVDLVVGNTVYGVCRMNSGEQFVSFSSLSCTVSNALTAGHHAIGQVSLPMTFNVGQSGSSVDLETSSCFKPGINTVTFEDGPNKLSIQADFQTGTADPSLVINSQRLIQSLEKSLAVLIAPDCPSGYSSGTIGFSSTDPAYQLDCSSADAGLTSQLNAWNNPEDKIDYPFTRSCTSKGFSISFSRIDAGFRPFLSALATVPSANTYKVSYTIRYTCSNDGKPHDERIEKTWNPYQRSNAGGQGVEIVVTTRTGTETATVVTTRPFNSGVDRTKTVE